jgi:hypothetical protein
LTGKIHAGMDFTGATMTFPQLEEAMTAGAEVYGARVGASGFISSEDFARFVKHIGLID